jgi:hypothetical protein
VLEVAILNDVCRSAQFNFQQIDEVVKPQKVSRTEDKDLLCYMDRN